MTTALTRAFTVAAIAGLTLSAQWTNVTTKGVPRTASGAVNLQAPAPRTPDGKPDLSGIWESEFEPCTDAFCDDVPQGYPKGVLHIGAILKEPVPFRPWAEALFKQRSADLGKDSPFSKCLPLNPPRAWNWFSPRKIVQTPDMVLVLEEDNIQFRQIFLDGRKLPADPEPMFKGYSVGRWEGDTLVVESKGYKDGQWLDLAGSPMTDQARMVERLRRVSYGRIQVEVTLDDPKAYTRPFTFTFGMTPLVDQELLEYICTENERDQRHLVGKGDSK
jgi:hypothetical protein